MEKCGSARNRFVGETPTIANDERRDKVFAPFAQFFELGFAYCYLYRVNRYIMLLLSYFIFILRNHRPIAFLP